MGVSGNALLGTGTAQQHLYSNTPRHSSVQCSSSGGKPRQENTRNISFYGEKERETCWRCKVSSTEPVQLSPLPRRCFLG